MQLYAPTLANKLATAADAVNDAEATPKAAVLIVPTEVVVPLTVKLMSRLVAASFT